MGCKASGHHLRMGSTRLSYFFPFTVFLESFLLLTFPYRKRGKESLSKSVKPNKEDSMTTVFYSKSNTGKAAKPLSCDLIRKSDHKWLSLLFLESRCKKVCGSSGVCLLSQMTDAFKNPCHENAFHLTLNDQGWMLRMSTSSFIFLCLLNFSSCNCSIYILMAELIFQKLISKTVNLMELKIEKE